MSDHLLTLHRYQHDVIAYWDVGWNSTCTCGWASEQWDRKKHAVDDAIEHMKTTDGRGAGRDGGMPQISHYPSSTERPL
jgi:hypothetical protein